MIPQVIIAVALMALIGSIMITAIIKYDIEKVLRMWGALGAITGVLAGSMITYFFSKAEIETAEQKAEDANVSAGKAEKRAFQAQQEIIHYRGKIDQANKRVATLNSELIKVRSAFDKTSNITVREIDAVPASTLRKMQIPAP